MYDGVCLSKDEKMSFNPAPFVTQVVTGRERKRKRGREQEASPQSGVIKQSTEQRP